MDIHALADTSVSHRMHEESVIFGARTAMPRSSLNIVRLVHLISAMALIVYSAS